MTSPGELRPAQRSVQTRFDRGQVFDNPVTGERAVILTSPSEHPTGLLVAHLFVRPGGRVAAEHVHPALTERYHVLHGQLAVSLDGHRSTLHPGQRAHVPPGMRHDWWQTGDDEAEVVVEVDPGLRFAEMLTSMWGLVRDGRTGGRAMPGPLQMAVTGAAYREVMVVASPPAWVQRVLFGTLGPIGRILGRRPSYPEYWQSATNVDPDPDALALLTPEGALDWRDGASA